MMDKILFSIAVLALVLASDVHSSGRAGVGNNIDAQLDGKFDQKLDQRARAQQEYQAHNDIQGHGNTTVHYNITHVENKKCVIH